MVNENDKQYFEVPRVCFVCGHATQENGKFLICPNDECSALEYGNLYKWIAALDIKAIGDAIIEMLQNKDLINEPADFYKLTKNDISELEGLGDKSAEKILKNLHAKMEIDLEIFVAGLNIKGVSESIAKSLISAGYDTINKMFDATIDQLIQIKGIEFVTAEKINKGFKSKLNVIKNLLDAGITIKRPLIITDGKLKDLSFCVTGSLATMKRKDFEDLVKKNGGQLKSVGKGLSYLVTNDPNSGSEKNNKAQQLGIKLITEDQFLAMTK